MTCGVHKKLSLDFKKKKKKTTKGLAIDKVFVNPKTYL